MNNRTRINRSLLATMALFLTLGILLTACGDDEGGITPATPTEPVFRQLGALSTVTNWEKAWGLSVSNMFLMGEDGLVFQRNGSVWDSLNSTTGSDRDMFSAWGDRENKIFFVGRQVDGIADTVWDSTVDPPTYVVEPTADRPILADYDGNNFLELPTSFQWGLFDIWGAAADTIFAVGYDGSILQFDGTDWNIVATGGDSPAWLNAVWGTSGSSVYVSGTDGAFLHYDGSEWSAIASHTGEDLWDVWGLSDSSVYCVGSNGKVLHYDGTGVTIMPTPITNTLYSIWGHADDDLYAVGWNGIILHYDGTEWTEVDSQTRYGFVSVWGLPGGSMYVAGQTVYEFDGGTWTPLKVRNEPDFTDIWAGIADDGATSEIVAVGTGGNILYNTSSFSFSPMTVDGDAITTDLNGVGGVDGEAKYVVGDGGLILQRNSETNWTSPATTITADLFDVAVLSDDLAMAVGANGTRAAWDGSSWTEAPFLTGVSFYGVWLGATTAGDTIAYAAGQGGVTAEYDGSSWSFMNGPGSTDLHDIVGFESGNAYAVGDNGLIWHYVSGASGWTAVSSGTVENLTSIWAANETNMFIAGESGRVFQFNGTTMTELETGVGIDFAGVAGFSAEQIYVVGANNHMLLYSN